MTNFFHRIIHFFLIAFIALSLTSCSSTQNNSSDKNTKIRIVDLKGKPHSVKMRTPELNVQALADQGNLTEDKLETIEQKTPTSQQEIIRNKYAGTSVEALQDTMQTPVAPEVEKISAPIIATTKTNPPPQESETAGVVASKKNKTIEYELNIDEEDNSIKQKSAKSPKAPKIKDEKPVSPTKNRKEFFVQTGSFSIMQHAKNSAQEIEQATKKTMKIEEAAIGEKIVYRVLNGPFANKKQALKTIQTFENAGFKAIIIKK